MYINLNFFYSHLITNKVDPLT